eukprot:747770-Hanusia_phi.AAC.1
MGLYTYCCPLLRYAALCAREGMTSSEGAETGRTVGPCTATSPPPRSWTSKVERLPLRISNSSSATSALLFAPNPPAAEKAR